MRYKLAPIHCRPWTLHSLSHKLIESHCENNYGGGCATLDSTRNS
jgi:superoxide dismutase, Fe-Mn family